MWGHNCNSSTWEQKKDSWEFKAILCHIASGKSVWDTRVCVLLGGGCCRLEFCAFVKQQEKTWQRIRDLPRRRTQQPFGTKPQEPWCGHRRPKGQQGHRRQSWGPSVPFTVLLWNCSCFPGHSPSNSGVESPKSTLLKCCICSWWWEQNENQKPRGQSPLVLLLKASPSAQAAGECTRVL